MITYYSSLTLLPAVNITSSTVCDRASVFVCQLGLAKKIYFVLEESSHFGGFSLDGVFHPSVLNNQTTVVQPLVLGS